MPSTPRLSLAILALATSLLGPSLAPLDASGAPRARFSVRTRVLGKPKPGLRDTWRHGIARLRTWRTHRGLGRLGLAGARRRLAAFDVLALRVARWTEESPDRNPTLVDNEILENLTEPVRRGLVRLMDAQHERMMAGLAMTTSERDRRIGELTRRRTTFEQTAADARGVLADPSNPADSIKQAWFSLKAAREEIDDLSGRIKNFRIVTVLESDAALAELLEAADVEIALARADLRRTLETERRELRAWLTRQPTTPIKADP